MTADPYFRVLQPKTPTSTFVQSSYLRLGGYVADEATTPALRTGLTTSTSAVGVDSSKGGASQQADAAEENSKKDPAKVYTATSQSSTAYKTTATAVAATNSAGILMYSDGELNVNIGGAALEKFGQGHVTDVTHADAKYTVPDGKYDLNVLKGIFIRAGSINPDDGALVTGTDGTTAATASNLELTASGYIKQTAYGPLDEITYGTTRKNFHGDAFDEFHGFKESKFYGREHTYKMSGVLSMTLAAECVLKLGSKFELTAGIDLGIRLAADLKIFVGLKLDMVGIADIKLVRGFSLKYVWGQDFKSATSDMKLLTTTDIKMAPVGDMKNVGLNMTVCNMDIKVEMAAIGDAKLAAEKKDLQTSATSLAALLGQTTFSTDTLRLFT